MDFFNKCTEVIERRSFNGIVSVEVKGKPFFEKIRNDLSSEDPTSNSLFFIGSISKPMLSLVILKYAELGVLNLYVPIINYIPELKNILGTNRITLEHLLTHTSGLITSTGREKAKDYIFNFKKIGKFIYANQGYELAAKIVTKITGKSLGTLFQELFRQCEMEDSFIINNDDCDIRAIKETYPQLIQGYIYVPKLHAYIMSNVLTNPWDIKSGYTQAKQPFKDGFQYLYPEAGNVVSTIRDLHKWNQFYEKIDKLVLHEYIKRRVFNIKNNGRAFDFCLGMRKGIQEPKEFEQSGWVYGYQSTSLFFPESQISVVILENVSRIGGLKIPPLDFSTHGLIIDKVREYIGHL